MGYWYNFLVVSIFLFSLSVVSIPLIRVTNGQMTSLEIVEAEEGLISAYDVVIEAEDIGANVTSLLDMLNDGENYLAEAYSYLRLGDFESADRLADSCIEIVNQVKTQATLLREEVARSEKADFTVRVLGSSVGVVIVVVTGYLLWRSFKRYYMEKILQLRPEVNHDES